MRQWYLTMILSTLVGCTPAARDADTTGMGDRTAETAAPQVPASVDHVLLAVHDLQAGLDEFERLTGVRAQIGGAHPGRGTRNALVSLGGASYLEILAPNPADPAGPAMSAQLAQFTSLTPYGWAVRSEDLDGLADSLRARNVSVSDISPGARVRADGSRLEWRTLNVEAPSSSYVPFFIQWAAFSPHPSTTSPMGCTLRGLRFAAPAPDELRATFERLGIAAEVSSGEQAMMRVRLECPKGTVEFPPPRG